MSVVSLCKQDSQFVVDYCINAPWPLYETAQEMLNYAKAKVRGFISLNCLYPSIPITCLCPTLEGGQLQTSYSDSKSKCIINCMLSNRKQQQGLFQPPCYCLRTKKFTVLFSHQKAGFSFEQ